MKYSIFECVGTGTITEIYNIWTAMVSIITISLLSTKDNCVSNKLIVVFGDETSDVNDHSPLELTCSVDKYRFILIPVVLVLTEVIIQTVF